MLKLNPTYDSPKFVMESVSWQDVRVVTKSVNPQLAEIIDSLDPNKNYRLLRLNYPYGADIVHKGIIQIPGENKVLSYLDPAVPSFVKEMIGYSTIPLCLLLNKASEVYIEVNERLIPLNILQPGSVFGLFETLSMICNYPMSIPAWSVSAGARSTFLLPKITDAISHRKLCMEYKMLGDPPKNPLDQANIFSCINQQRSSDNRWYSDILMFSGDWFKNSKDPAWLTFQNYLFKQGWIHTKFEYDNKSRHMLWESLASAIAKRRLKPRAYLIDTVKHLVSIGTGFMPGFTMANQSETALPSRSIEEAYINTYKLDYLPIIAYPHMLRDADKSNPVYYFMAYPTLFAGSPTQRGTPSIMMDLREIKTIIETLYKHINHDQVFSGLSGINFSYFHPEVDKLEEILHTAKIPSDDPGIIDCNKRYPDKTFPINAPFMPGCIRIKRNQSYE